MLVGCVALLVASALGYIHADSGAMYRTLTLACMERFGAGESAAEFGESLAKAGLAASSLQELGVSVVLAENEQSNRLGGEDAPELGELSRVGELRERHESAPRQFRHDRRHDGRQPRGEVRQPRRPPVA